MTQAKSSDPYFSHRGKFSLRPFLGAEQISPTHHLSRYQRCAESSGSHALYISTWWGKVGIFMVLTTIQTILRLSVSRS